MFHPTPVAAALAAAALLAGAGGVAAQTNVSRLVLGTHHSIPTNPGPITECTGCSYTWLTSAGLSDSLYVIQPMIDRAGLWPPSTTSTPARLPTLVDDAVAPGIPSGEAAHGGAVGVADEASIRFPHLVVSGGANQLRAQNWGSGSAVAHVGYHIRIQTPASGARATYLEFGVPERSSQVQYPYNIEQSGNFKYSFPFRLQMRTLVDVWVDGLPVWSGSDHVLKPKDMAPSGPGGVHRRVALRYGEALSGGKVTLFLGTLPAGSSIAVTLAMRVDSRVDAGACQSTTETGAALYHCHAQSEVLTLPRVTQAVGFASEYRPDIRVYTR